MKAPHSFLYNTFYCFSTATIFRYKMAEEKGQSGFEISDNDQNVVGWDGPDDPKNPLNWPASIRYGHVVLVSAITLAVYVYLTYIDFPSRN